MKVVYNACFGGFSLSRKAIERLAELGNEDAINQVNEGFEEDKQSFYLWDTPRHDPILVQVVEELGNDADGRYSALCVHELSGRQYTITDYDGHETVEEPSTKRWTST